MNKIFVGVLAAFLVFGAAGTENKTSTLTATEKSASIVKNSSSAVKGDRIEQILDGNEVLPVVTENEVENWVEHDWRAVRRWLDRERHNLERGLIGSAVVLAICLGLGFLARFWSRHYDVGTAPLRIQLLDALVFPFLALVALCGVFAFLLPVLHALPELHPWDSRLFFTLLTLTAAWCGFRLITLIDFRLHAIARRDDNKLDTLMVEITRKVLKISLALFTVLFIGQSVFNLNITTLLAGAGVIGLAVAFASRETLSNFFGTLVIILDRPFRIGDRIRINDTDGLVESVGMRSTRLLTDSESNVTIPNSRIAESVIENISSRGVIRHSFTLGLEYSTTDKQLAQAIALAHKVVDDFEGPDQKRYRPRVFFAGFGASSLNIQVIMWLKTTDFATEEEWRTRIGFEMLRRFNAAGFNMAFNTFTAYLREDTPVKSSAEAPVAKRKKLASAKPDGGASAPA